MKRSRFQTYNDGVVTICIAKGEKADFGAVHNITNQGLIPVVKLAYGEMSKRDEDLDFAESRGNVLGMKIRVRLNRCVEKTHMAIIGDTVYSIYKLDYSREKQEMYLYLQEVRKL